MVTKSVPENVRKALDEFKNELMRTYSARLKAVYLYGSHARGTATDDSDIDVMVVLDGDVFPADEISRISGVLSDICLRHDLLLSVFPVSETWYSDRQSSLFINVRREGVPV